MGLYEKGVGLHNVCIYSLQDLLLFSLKFNKIIWREPIIEKIVFSPFPQNLEKYSDQSRFPYTKADILDTSKAPLKTELNYKKSGFPFSIRLIKRF